MYICEDNHEEIVHDLTVYHRPNCPLCEANERIEKLECERDDLKDQVDALEADE